MRISIVRSGKYDQRREGAAAVEAALVLPLIMMLLLGTWEVGRMTEATQIMDTATREASRQASTGVISYDQIKTIVINDLTQAGLTNLNGLTVQVTNLTTSDTGPGTHGLNINDYDPTNANQNDQLEIKLSMPFENVRWSPHLISSGSTTLNSKAIWVCLKDRDFPTTVSPPDGF